MIQELQAMTVLNRKPNSGEELKQSDLRALVILCNLKHTPGTSKDVRHPITSSTSTVTCFNCRGVWHYAENCPAPGNVASSGGPAGLTAVKKVHLCEVATPCGKLSHSGEKLSFCYDSVLEYSFMKKSISCKIKKKAITCDCNYDYYRTS